MGSDIHTPEEYGIYQAVGDTAGPGGYIRGLRTVPMFIEIAEAIKTYCPSAWVINYTNPMSLCVKTLYKTFPEIKAFGCCHEVFNTQALLVDILNKELNTNNISRKDIYTDVIGINHFTWFTKATYRDIDIFPIYQKYAEKYYQSGYEFSSNPLANHYFICAHRVKFDLFLKYHSIAAAGDRHLAEFMPGDLYLTNPEVVKQWRFSLTPISYRQDNLAKRLERSKRLYEGKEKIKLKPTGEEGVQLIKALCGLGNKVSNVNLPNYALQISNLPNDAIIETNALFANDEVSPIYAGKMPEDIKELTIPHIENHERIYQAVIKKDRKLVYKAFENDPLIHRRLNKRQIKELVDKMIDNTSKYCDL